MTIPQVQLDRMSEIEYRELLAVNVPAYAAEKVKAGTWSREEASAKAQVAFDELLPDGVGTPDHFLFTVCDRNSGKPVARLWLGRGGNQERRGAFIYTIEVDQRFRGRGSGRATMAACLEEARKHGAVSVGLHVFGSNKVARSLYTSLGFAEVSVMMSLP